MANIIRIKRGLKDNLPTLLVGELAFCTDTNELFIGKSTGNTLVNDLSILQNYFTKEEVEDLAGTGLSWNSVTEKFDIDNPFNPSGTFVGLRAQATTAADVGLGNVTNESKTTMFTDPVFTGTVSGIDAEMVGLGNVTNESKATMFTNPTFTGEVGGVTAEMVGLGNVTNESKATMFTDPTFTGTVSGVTAEMVGLGNVTNESKATMFTNPTFTGTVSGVNAEMVGLGNVTNESKATMFTDPTFTGTVTIGNQGSLTGVPAPSIDLDAANKAYVDQVAQGIKSRTQAQVFVEDNLPGTYNSVPELHEFTSSTNGAFPSVDGVDSEILNVEGSRVVLAGQSNPAHNGLYVLKTSGSESNPWVLRRCVECSTSEQIPGSYVFVTKGDDYKNTGWVFEVDSPSTFQLGTDPIIVAQFSGAGSFTAGNGLVLSATEFSADIASQAEAEAGAINNKLMTPLRTTNSIDARLRTSGNSGTGAVLYNGTSRAAGTFYGGTANPTSTTRLNYDGNLHVRGFTADNITETSTLKLKKNIRPLNFSMELFNSLSPVLFEWKDKEPGDQIGLIAEDVYKIFPEIVTLSPEKEVEGVQYTKLTLYLIEAVKELSKEIQEIKNNKN